MIDRSTVYFRIESFSFSIGSGNNVSFLRISGWYHDSTWKSDPEIKVLSGGRQIGMLDFYIERPDVETKFGKLSYSPGFSQTMVIGPFAARLEFIDQRSGRVLLSRDILKDYCAKKKNFHDSHLMGIFSELSFREKLKMRLRTVPVEWSIFLLQLKSLFSTRETDVIPDSELYLTTRAPIIKLLFFSHNLNFEGAPNVLYNIARGLLSKNYDITVVSPFEGRASAHLNDAGIKTRVLADRPEHTYDFLYRTPEGLLFQQEKIRHILLKEKPDLVFVNVVLNCFIVDLAARMKIPVIWMIHESFTFYEQQEHVPHFKTRDYFRAFSQAAYVVFCSQISKEYYRRYDFRRNFRVIYNSLEPKYATLPDQVWKRDYSRKKLNISPDETVILYVSILVEHKNQELLVRAAGLLKEPGLRYFLVGEKKGIQYCTKVKKLIKTFGLEEKMTVVHETADTDVYYSAADIFVFTSNSDTYPLVILEAMSFGLPIIATPINGVNEQVRFGTNALKADYSDPEALASQIKRLSEDKNLRLQMGQSSRAIFQSLDPYEKMIENFHELVMGSLRKGKS
jgi:glycosyltransferase involved in cell wall biosynthesis